MHKVVSTVNAPAAIGPYSQAIEANGIVFVSGQIPLDPLTGIIVGKTVTEQTHQALKNLSAVLAAAGCTLEMVVKTTCFLADMNDFAAFNEVYAGYFPAVCPARACVAVKSLPKGSLVEVDAIAVKP